MPSTAASIQVIMPVFALAAALPAVNFALSSTLLVSALVDDVPLGFMLMVMPLSPISTPTSFSSFGFGAAFVVVVVVGGGGLVLFGSLVVGVVGRRVGFLKEEITFSI